MYIICCSLPPYRSRRESFSPFSLCWVASVAGAFTSASRSFAFAACAVGGCGTCGFLDFAFYFRSSLQGGRKWHGPRSGNDFWGQRANNFATLATDPRSVVVVVVLLPLCFLGKRQTRERERAFRCYLHYCHREHITIKVGSRHHQAAAAASWVGSSVPVLLPISVVRRGRAPRTAFGSQKGRERAYDAGTESTALWVKSDLFEKMEQFSPVQVAVGVGDR